MAEAKPVIVPTGTGQAEALLLSCIDYRLPGKIARYMEGRGLDANYDHVILAGASLGVTNTVFPHWGRSFRDHLDLAIKLHGIRRVIILDHRECGSYRVIFGTNLAGDEEKAQHARELHRLAREIRETYPSLHVEKLLMALDGSIETVE
ncbi:MAG TPA: carbonic anhydrase [Stellaceae bacterium]|nr:carbonic anhydrase [Stellaceae bacterium]